MAPTGFLLTIALALAADPGGGDPYGSLRESGPREFPEPALISPLAPPAGGWSVSNSPPEIAAASHERRAEDPQPAAPPPNPRPAPHEAAAPLENEEPSHALKLAPPSKSRASESDRKPPGAGGAITSVVSSLAVVLGLFFVLVWLAKRGSPKGAATLPAEVLEVLGRGQLTPRQQLHVVRFGNKLVLLSLSPTGAEPLAEIDDPVEVERVLGICQEMQQGSITESFRPVFSQFANEPAQEGFAGREGARHALRE
jgi:flagellar biogenesis protein FliO